MEGCTKPHCAETYGVDFGETGKGNQMGRSDSSKSKAESPGRKSVTKAKAGKSILDANGNPVFGISDDVFGYEMYERIMLTPAEIGQVVFISQRDDKLDEAHLRKIEKRVRDGLPLDPPRMRRSSSDPTHTLYCGGGRYRCRANVNLNKEMEVHVFDGGRREAWRESLRSNGRDELARTDGELERAIRSALADEEYCNCTNVEIADMTDSSDEWVGRVRKKILAETREKARKDKPVAKAIAKTGSAGARNRGNAADDGETPVPTPADETATGKGESPAAQSLRRAVEELKAVRIDGDGVDDADRLAVLIAEVRREADRIDRSLRGHWFDRECFVRFMDDNGLDCTDMGKLIGTERANVSRWRSDNQKPGIRFSAAIERVLSMSQEQIQAWKSEQGKSGKAKSEADAE